MSITALLLMTLGMPLQVPSAPDPCDSTCAAVAEAALEYAISEAKESMSADPDRMYLDLSRLPSEIEWAATAAQVTVAEAHDMVARDMRTHPARIACSQARLSSACRSARGVTEIAVTKVNVSGPDRADAWIVINVIAGDAGEEKNWDSVRISHVKLARIDDVWTVETFGLTIVS